MKRKPILLALAPLGLAILSVAPSGAVPGPYYDALVAARGINISNYGIDNLTPAGRADLTFVTGTSVSDYGDLPSTTPSPAVAVESRNGYVSACYNGGCVYGSVSGTLSPPYPVDPLLQGGTINLVADGTGTCSAPITVRVNVQGTAEYRFEQDFIEEVAPLQSTNAFVYGRAEVERGADVLAGGSISSCLGTAAWAALGHGAELFEYASVTFVG